MVAHDLLISQRRPSCIVGPRVPQEKQGRYARHRLLSVRGGNTHLGLHTKVHFSQSWCEKGLPPRTMFGLVSRRGVGAISLRLCYHPHHLLLPRACILQMRSGMSTVLIRWSRARCSLRSGCFGDHRLSSGKCRAWPGILGERRLVEDMCLNGGMCALDWLADA